MAQVNKSITWKTFATGVGAMAVATFCANLLFSPATVTQLDTQALSSITTQGTFKTVQGDGLRAIHIFLSTDCSFCKKIEPELDHLENVTIYRHMLPGHTEAGRLAASAVWCSTSQIKVWKAVATGAAVAPAKCDVSLLEKNLALAKQLGLATTPSIIYEDGRVSAGMLTAIEIAKRLAKPAKG